MAVSPVFVYSPCRPCVSVLRCVCVCHTTEEAGRKQMRWVEVEEGRKTWWKYIFLITVGEVNAAYPGEEDGLGVGGTRRSQPDRKWRRTALKAQFLPPRASWLFVVHGERRDGGRGWKRSGGGWKRERRREGEKK